MTCRCREGKASGSCGASWPASLRPYGPAIIYAAGLVTKLVTYILFYEFCYISKGKYVEIMNSDPARIFVLDLRLR
jgi:hypothetical protein